MSSQMWLGSVLWERHRCGGTEAGPAGQRGGQQCGGSSVREAGRGRQGNRDGADHGAPQAVLGAWTALRVMGALEGLGQGSDTT